MSSRVLLVTALGLGAVGCSKREAARHGPGPGSGSGSAVEVVQGRPGYETDEEIIAQAEALEAAAQRGEFQWSRTEGHDLVMLGKDGTPRTLPFPAPLHGHGDSVSEIWMAPDGTLFTAGYMITGVPGPDTGAIHRMQPGGPIERVFELAERELWSVWGRSANDVYAVGPKIVVHWDGTEWSWLGTNGVVGTINTVTGTATELYIVAVDNDPEQSRIYRLAGTTWKREVEVPCVLRGLSIANETAYAAGFCNTVFRRGSDGAWTTERIPQGGALDVVAVSDSVAYVAAEQLLRRNPDGTWVVADAGFPRVHSVYRGPGEQVFVLGNLVESGGASGVALGSGDTFTRLPLKNCGQVTAAEGVTYCVHERYVASAPPPDLR